MAKKDHFVGASAAGSESSFASDGEAAALGVGEAGAEAQMFRSLADHSLEFIGMCDLEFKPFYVNAAGRRMVGLGSLTEACAVRVQDYFFPEDQPFISEEFFPKVLREGRWEVEIRFRHFQTGEAVWMIYNVFQVRDLQGRVSGYATVSRDITERKRVEEAMRFLVRHDRASSEEFFPELARYLAQCLNMDFVCIDRLESNLLAARTLAVYFDGQFEDNLAYTLKDTPCGAVVEHKVCCFAQHVRALFPRDEVLQRMGAEGYIGTILWSSQGQPIGLIAVISRRPVAEPKLATSILQLAGVRAAAELERQQAAAALRQSEARSKAKLERLVAERTEKLREMVGELEHFSYTITHDLKSPLRAMHGFAEMMSLTCGECERVRAKEFLDRIATSAERMDHLISDALNYSRSVRQELPLGDVDAGALLRGMLDSYPELQPEKARIRVEGRLPVVRANAAGLTQCLSNLLGNAVKFVRPGEQPDIRVGASPQGAWVRIWVEDRGIGISRDMLPRVFDMFSRGSKDYEGTGIGLALVRKVAQRMGGKVGVESEEGKGSRFWIELKSGEAKLGGPQAAAAAAGGGAGGAGTVLYVEDEESDALFMERAFAEKGLAGKLQLVGSGRAAIDYLSGAGEFGDREKYPVPALVVLDLNLPQVSGFGVLEWLRNHPDYARLPVVVFSSSTREDDQVKARELGADEFVAKPSSGLKFGEVVESLQQRWLGKRQGEAQNKLATS